MKNKHKQRGKQFRRRSEKAQNRPPEQQPKKNRSQDRSQNRPQNHGPLLEGKVQKNPAGFAFLVATKEGFDDVYVDRRQAASLMQGDIVEFTIEKKTRPGAGKNRGFQGRHSRDSIRGKPAQGRDQGRDQDTRTSARIVNVVKRGRQQVVGQLVQQGRKWNLISPEGDAIDIRAPMNEGEHVPGQWVVADIEKYPQENKNGFGRVSKRLGESLGPKHDMELAIARYNIPKEFSRSTLAEASSFKEAADKEGANTIALPAWKSGDKNASFIADRVDLKNLPLVTIDGEDAKDFDDAVYVEKVSEGYKLFVAIADVSFFVSPGTSLDHDARTRGTSVYFPGTCVPMLPEELSNDLCSLRPKVPRLALTAEILFSKTGDVLRSRFYPAVIQTADRLTYTQVQSFLDGKKDAIIPAVHGPLDTARELFEKLLERRADRGVLDFDLPECKVQLDENGFPVRVFQAEKLRAHKLIEEFMIAANRAVAEALKNASVPCLYRVHEAPDPESLEELNALLYTMGVKAKVEKLTPKAFAQVLESTTDTKIAGSLHHIILRLQKQAKYIPEPLGHFGLALADYTHFTSPIRRYPDLIVHRALKTLCLRSVMSDKRDETISSVEMHSLGMQTSDAERRAMEAERFVLKRKQCWHMERRLGDEFEGIVCGMTSAGFFVLIPWMAVEGFVPLEFMREHYDINPDHYIARGPGSKALHLGDSIKISVTRVSLDDNRITFSEST